MNYLGYCVIIALSRLKESFNERYMAIQQQMFKRNAPESQIRQLEEIRKRYQEKTKGRELDDI